MGNYQNLTEEGYQLNMRRCKRKLLVHESKKLINTQGF